MLHKIKNRITGEAEGNEPEALLFGDKYEGKLFLTYLLNVIAQMAPR